MQYFSFLIHFAELLTKYLSVTCLNKLLLLLLIGLDNGWNDTQRVEIDLEV